MNTTIVPADPPPIDPEYRRYLVALNLFHQAAAESTGLSGTDYQASNLLDLDGPMTSSELARRLALTNSATTRLVDRLVKAGIARRAPDPGDRRRAVIEHTGHQPAGLAEILDEVRGPIELALQDLSPEQLQGVQQYLTAATNAYAAAARNVRAATDH